MTFLIVSLSGLVFVLVLIAFYRAALNSDNKRSRLSTITKTYRKDFDEDLELPFVQRVLLPMISSIIKNLSNLMPKNKGNTAQRTEKNLRLAGVKMTVNEYNASRFVFSAGGVLASIIASVFLPIEFPIKVLIVFVGFLTSVIVPVFHLKHKITKRQEGITNQLPDVLDLLSVSIEAGLGFDAALVKIGERLSGLLVDELNIVLLEIHMGRPRREALRGLAERSPVEELKTFVSSMIQAEQLGIPIKNVLHSQSTQLRVTRRQKAEEKAMKAPVKMMIPLVTLVFPVLFIVLLGPTVLQMMDQF